MSEREPRRRKKPKKEGIKKVSILEEVSSDEAPKKAVDLTDEEEEITSHDPSSVAKSIFCILFIALLGGVGVIFLSLRGADRSIELFEEPPHIITDTPLSDIVPEESSKEEKESIPSLIETTIVEDSVKDIPPSEKDNSQEEVISDSLFDYLWTESLTIQTEVPITSVLPVIEDDIQKEDDSVIEIPFEVKEEAPMSLIESEESDSSKEDTFFQSTETPVKEHPSPTESLVISPTSEFIWEESELPNVNKDPDTSSPAVYENLDITNEEDFIDRQELDELDELLEKDGNDVKDADGLMWF